MRPGSKRWTRDSQGQAQKVCDADCWMGCWRSLSPLGRGMRLVTRGSNTPVSRPNRLYAAVPARSRQHKAPFHRHSGKCGAINSAVQSKHCNLRLLVSERGIRTHTMDPLCCATKRAKGYARDLCSNSQRRTSHRKSTWIEKRVVLHRGSGHLESSQQAADGEQADACLVVSQQGISSSHLDECEDFCWSTGFESCED